MAVEPDRLCLRGRLGWGLADVRVLLESGFGVLTGRATRHLHRWLDTADWRLHRAGCRLVQLGARGELVLTRVDGAELARSAAPAHWPARLADLPAGPVRDRVAGLLGPRALLIVGSTNDSVTPLRLLDAEAKTVARVEVRAGRPDQGPWLEITAVRGYAGSARRAERLLVAGGAEPSTDTEFELALAAAGRRPGDYSNRVDTALAATAPAQQSVARVLLDILTGLEANVAGTIDDTDPEFLHDLRVNVRRTRTALKLAGDGLPPGQAERFAPDFAWLGALTSPVRDLDVHLLELDEVSDLDGLEPLRTHLLARRRAQRRRLLAGLRSARFADLRTQWRHELDAAIGSAGPGMASTGEFAARRIVRANRRLIKRGTAIDEQSPAEQLHGVRKRGKELRYLLEFFASLYDPAGYKKVVGELRALQDVLGRFQDACTQREALEEFAEQLSGRAPARTLLAMGELAGRLDTRVESRAEFAARFARFAGARNQRRLLELTQDRTGP